MPAPTGDGAEQDTAAGESGATEGDGGAAAPVVSAPTVPASGSNTIASAEASMALEPVIDLEGLASSATPGASAVPNAVATLPSTESDVSISAAEAEGNDLFVAGMAEPGTRVEVFADGAFVGSAVATATGNWLVEAEAALAQGEILLSAEAIGADETQPETRVEASFFRVPDAIVLEPMGAAATVETAEASASGRLPPPVYVIIRRGDNLWRISRRNYGRGIRYESIFAANSELIEDPDLIFPGQVFIMPEYDRGWEEEVVTN